MPQIKKNRPINFKPSDETLVALEKLKAANPGSTTTALIEAAIQQAAQ